MPTEKLREPKTPFQRLVRELAEAAMAITHHDIDDRYPEYIHEIASMERAFVPKIRGFIAARARRVRAHGD